MADIRAVRCRRLAGFRARVVGEYPVAARLRGSRPAASPYPAGGPRPGMTARFLTLVTERHGSLASVPLERVAGIAAALAPQVGLNAGSARVGLSGSPAVSRCWRMTSVCRSTGGQDGNSTPSRNRGI